MLQWTVFSWGQQLLGRRDGPKEVFTPQTERRTSVRYLSNLSTDLRPAHAPQSEPCSGKVRDVSRGGISLHVDRPFARGSMLSLQLEADAEQPGCTLLACVVHVTPRPGNNWLLGCTFAADLCDDDLRAFGAGRVKSAPGDQRTWERSPCALEASCRPAQDKPETQADATVFDISASGVGLLTARPIDVGTVFSLELHGSADQPALNMLACVVRVAAQADGTWALGCNFLRELSERELRPFLAVPV